VITAVDTNILLDLLIPEAPHQASSERRLQTAVEDGAVIMNEAVYAELGAHFSDDEDL
jgi:predicted nucleic acid-binding protein